MCEEIHDKTRHKTSNRTIGFIFIAKVGCAALKPFLRTRGGRRKRDIESRGLSFGIHTSTQQLAEREAVDDTKREYCCCTTVVLLLYYHNQSQVFRHNLCGSVEHEVVGNRFRRVESTQPQSIPAPPTRSLPQTQACPEQDSPRAFASLVPPPSLAPSN